MRIRQVWRAAAVAAGITALAAGTALASASAATSSPGDAGHGHHGDRVRHVLLISVDGLHQQDLAWYIKNYPGSLLAALARHGLEYSNARTPFPSDPFPGNAVQGSAGSADSILKMPGTPLNVINPPNLPVNPKPCKPIYPNQYLKVNTIFDVARQHGLRTAWSDKHPAYQALSGPSGNGVQDYFTPEINSQAIGYPAGEDWTSDNAATMQYDSYKVQAILNEIDGYDHSRTHHVGVPGIFGMNFQTVSTAQKMPTSNGLTGGY